MIRITLRYCNLFGDGLGVSDIPCCCGLSPWFHSFNHFFQIAVMMIMRVYAMWNRSKRILYALLFIYVPQIIVSFVLTGIYDIPNKDFSGMSWAKLYASSRSHASCHLCQLQLLKFSISLFALVCSNTLRQHWQFTYMM